MTSEEIDMREERIKKHKISWSKKKSYLDARKDIELRKKQNVLPLSILKREEELDERY
jgi:hypothetical protein